MRRLIAALSLCVLLFSAGFAESVPPQAAESTPAPVSQLPAVMEQGGTLFVVNGKNRISKAYVPEDLVKPDVQTRKKSLENNILMQREASHVCDLASRLFRSCSSEAWRFEPRLVRRCHSSMHSPELPFSYHLQP